MGKTMLLDCTLRDGGYLNDWKFGYNAILDIEKKIVSTKVDIVEIGFLRKEEYNRDRTVFSSVDQIADIIAPKQEGMLYAGMVEIMNPLPIEDLAPRSDDTVDIIRIIVWKNNLEEGFEYCKAITEKGYKICVQPVRINQYSDQEFIDMIDLFSPIDPLAIYVVDSWGTQYRDSILKYIKLADEHMKDSIAIGFHGHNNLQQAFDCSEAFAELNLDRDVIIDASVYGIGRGAGNLSLELFAKYLNEKAGRDFNIKPMLEVYSKYLTDVFDLCPWGYSIPYYISAYYDCNPSYVNYYTQEKKISIEALEDILSNLNDTDKIIFTREKAARHLEEYCKKSNC